MGGLWGKPKDIPWEKACKALKVPTLVSHRAGFEISLGRGQALRFTTVLICSDVP